MSTPDQSAIEQTIQTYFDGLYEGDADKLAAAFHPTADLRWQEKGERRISWAFGGNHELWRADRLALGGARGVVYVGSVDELAAPSEGDPSSARAHRASIDALARRDGVTATSARRRVDGGAVPRGEVMTPILTRTGISDLGYGSKSYIKVRVTRVEVVP